ncbi:MAG: LytR C-terminal domain-containing protein [Deltaproteobacteria bacterium]|nr:LytR C-terminal domain-containing protein [Deltaproteobacteria bacterium]
MFRRVSVVFVVILCMTMSGCAAMRHVDGSSDEDMKKFRASKDDLWNETKKLKQDNEACRRTIQEKQGEIDQLTKQVANLNKDIEGLKTEVEQAKGATKNEIAKANGEDISLKDLVSPVKEKTITVEDKKSESSGPEKEGVKQDQKADVDKKDAPQTTTVEKGVEPKVLRVKVLSGNGEISSARAMSEKLKKLGYKIENTGLAPRSNFDVITIYFAPNYKSEAQQVAKQLGGAAIAKPLTWPSIFHVIVVTGP